MTMANSPNPCSSGRFIIVEKAIDRTTSPRDLCLVITETKTKLMFIAPLRKIGFR